MAGELNPRPGLAEQRAATAVEPTIVHHDCGSLRALVLAGGLRVIARPLGDVWPMKPRALRLIDAILVPAGWAARGASVQDVDAGGVRAELVRVSAVEHAERTVLHLHGGGFVFGAPRTYRGLAAFLSAACRAEVLVPDYRHPPRAPVPDMIADCLRAYRWLAAREDPARIVVTGDSAGGNLAFATLAAARDEGLPMPAGVVGMSAWLDLGYVHPRDAPRDAFFSLRFARRAAALCRDGDAPAAFLCPLDARVEGLPPVLLQVGSQEPLRPANERMAHHLAAAGVACELQLWHGQPHVFQVFAGLLPEGTAALREVGRFTRERSAGAGR